MCEWFSGEVAKLDWRKERPLPDWAQRIFSPWMVAAGNVQDLHELAQIRELAEMCVYNYTETVMETAGLCDNNAEQQNYYAQNQKLNPHTPKVMISLGLNEDDVRLFIQECLFPEIR